MMKKTCGTIAIGLIGIGRTFAANDCNVVLGTNIDQQVAIYATKGYQDVLPVEAFKQALINLKAHCCKEPDMLDCSKDNTGNLPQMYYPPSEFLFDHLLDVAMRRLDGITGLAYNLSLDPTGLERRTKINEIAKMASGAQASEIQKLYTGYWTLHQYEDINIIKNNYNKGIAIVSLRDKYDTICTLMKDIYDGVPNDNKTLIGKNLMNACENIAKNRVNKETSYTKMMMIEKSNQLFDEGTKAYLRKYFVQEKLMALWNLIVKVKDMFQTIIQQAPASKTCSK